MRINLNRVSVVLAAVLGVTGSAGLAAVGCGGDDTVVPGPDAADVTQPDARGDTNAVDGNNPDVTPDVLVDAGPDISPDAPAVPIGNFPQQVTTAFCTRERDCCLVDAGSWDQAGCENIMHGIYEYLSVGTYYEKFDDAGVHFYDGGNMVLDPFLANRCLTEVASATCGKITATEYLRSKQDCFLAMRGTIQPASADAGPQPNCTVSAECTQGNYCLKGTGTDGGPIGQCVPLKAVGDPCTLIAPLRSEECTFLGVGLPANYCIALADGGPTTCQPAQGLDAGCSQDQECQTQLCANPAGGNTVCNTSTILSDPGVPGGFCASLTK